jgi:hypothetical protein
LHYYYKFFQDVPNDVTEKNDDESKAECQQVGQAAGMKDGNMGHRIEAHGGLIHGRLQTLRGVGESNELWQ